MKGSLSTRDSYPSLPILSKLGAGVVTAGERTSAPMALVVNWTADLKR